MKRKSGVNSGNGGSFGSGNLNRNRKLKRGRNRGKNLLNLTRILLTFFQAGKKKLSGNRKKHSRKRKMKKRSASNMKERAIQPTSGMVQTLLKKNMIRCGTLTDLQICHNTSLQM